MIVIVYVIVLFISELEALGFVAMFLSACEYGNDVNECLFLCNDNSSNGGDIIGVNSNSSSSTSASCIALRVVEFDTLLYSVIG